MKDLRTVIDLNITPLFWQAELLMNCLQHGEGQMVPHKALIGISLRKIA